MRTYIDITFSTDGTVSFVVADHIRALTGVVLVMGQHDIVFDWKTGEEFREKLRAVHNAMAGTHATYRVQTVETEDPASPPIPWAPRLDEPPRENPAYLRPGERAPPTGWGEDPGAGIDPPRLGKRSRSGRVDPARALGGRLPGGGPASDQDRPRGLGRRPGQLVGSRDRLQEVAELALAERPGVERRIQLEQRRPELSEVAGAVLADDRVERLVEELDRIGHGPSHRSPF